MLADWRTAPVRAEVRAALGFLEKLVHTPDALTADDARAVYAVGVPREALERAIEVCAAFTVIVRVADTFDFEIGSEDDFDAGARSLWKRGYGF